MLRHQSSHVAEILPQSCGHRNLVCQASIILDHHMPKMTGLQLAEQLRGGGSLLPILLVTGLPSPSIVARAAELGIERVLEKPPEDDDILEFIASHTRHV